jgi:antibiotic biosynthesis monooxygenase (ABM) superfamily enzyme
MAVETATALAKPASLATAIMTKVIVLEGRDAAFATWQAGFTHAATAAPGFVSLEIIPAFAGAVEWRIIQRFQTAELLEGWQGSPVRRQFLSDLDALRGSAQGDLLDEVAPDFHSLSCVTEVITTEVEAGRVEAYQAWAKSAQTAQARFPGYMGTLVQAPISAEIPYWTTLVRYATPEQLEAWLASAERRAILEQSDPLVSHWKSQRLSNPFGGWFPTPPDQPPPAAWKQTCLVLLVLFPVVMLEIRFLSPLLTHAPMAIATFIGNAISVSLVSWPLMKFAIFLLGWWLTPDPKHRQRVEIQGIAAIAALYVAEILVFMLLY